MSSATKVCMQDKQFEYWSKARKQGGLAWIFKNTVGTTIAFVVFHILFNYPSSDAENVLMYMQANIAEYSIFPCLMFFVNWGFWLHRESKFKVELQRRNAE
ncbi:TPA: hypothetical protein N2909_002611 [Vibrio parahaemolyticus]|nr:hypothetical protein [Vibrio parahaemolyticus]